jgi:hypothetical protein
MTGTPRDKNKNLFMMMMILLILVLYRFVSKYQHFGEAEDGDSTFLQNVGIYW